MFLGIDSGSVSLKGVIIDDNNKIVKMHYTKNIGLIPSLKQVLKNLEIDKKIMGVGVTGSGRDFLNALIGADLVESEILSHYVATTTFYPDVKTIFDIGGEDSKLITINEHNQPSFAMNNACGGGCGGMIESIASRIGIAMEDIGETALKSKTSVDIPSKCGVFAQSAVVSKLNKGVPKEDIMMGVCRGLVGNYFAMLGKGKIISAPYVFQGATAKNKALVKCFEDDLKHKVIIPEYPEFMGAIGAAILSKENKKSKSNFKGFNNLDYNFETKTYYANGCTNKCEITEIYQDKYLRIAIIGNKCERCIK